MEPSRLAFVASRGVKAGGLNWEDHGGRSHRTKRRRTKAHSVDISGSFTHYDVSYVALPGDG